MPLLKLTLAACLLLTTPVSNWAAEPPLFYHLNATVIDSSEGEFEKPGFYVVVYLTTPRNGEEGEVDWAVSSMGFNEDFQILDPEEVTFFEAAAQAVKEGREYNQTAKIKTWEGESSVSYRSLPDGQVEVERSGVKHPFAPSMAASLRRAMEQAKAGAAWYELIVAGTDPMPEPNETCHPPSATEVFLNASLGWIDCGDFSFNFELRSGHGDEKIIQRTVIRFAPAKEDGSAYVYTDWFDDFLDKAEEALAADAAGEPFAWQHSEPNSDRGVSISVKPGSGQVDVVFRLGKLFGDENSLVNGTMDRETLQKIRAAQASFDDRKQWFRENWDGLVRELPWPGDAPSSE